MAIRKEGAFFEIHLSSGKFSYGRILSKASYAFYNVYSDIQIRDIDKIRANNILFINSVYKYAITKERWKKIGFLELETKLQILPLEFLEDNLNPGNFSIYNPNTGSITPTTKDKCIGLERAAVWEPQHIEDRLIDHFEGRQNKWVEQLKLR